MFDIGAWKAGVTVSRPCAAASIGTNPCKAAIAASIDTIAIDRILILLRLCYGRTLQNDDACHGGAPFTDETNGKRLWLKGRRSLISRHVADDEGGTGVVCAGVLPPRG